ETEDDDEEVVLVWPAEFPAALPAQAVVMLKQRVQAALDSFEWKECTQLVYNTALTHYFTGESRAVIARLELGALFNIMSDAQIAKILKGYHGVIVLEFHNEEGPLFLTVPSAIPGKPHTIRVSWRALLAPPEDALYDRYLEDLGELLKLGFIDEFGHIIDP